MVFKTIATAILLLVFTGTNAQVKKRIKKSRRNKSESQFVLAKGDVLFEWEAGRENFDDNLSTLSVPNMVLHYGITNRLEVNTEVSIVNVTDRSITPVKKITGAEPLLAGFNYLLCRENNKHPAVIITVQLAMPFIATKNFTANYVAPVIQLDIQQPVSKKFTAGFTPGIFWDGFAAAPLFTYTSALTFKPDKKWIVSSEVFGFIGQAAPQHNIDVETDYNLNKHLMLGITGGIGLSASAHKNYIGITGSYGLNRFAKKAVHNLN